MNISWKIWGLVIIVVILISVSLGAWLGSRSAQKANEPLPGWQITRQEPASGERLELLELASVKGQGQLLAEIFIDPDYDLPTSLDDLENPRDDSEFLPPADQIITIHGQTAHLDLPDCANSQEVGTYGGSLQAGVISQGGSLYELSVDGYCYDPDTALKLVPDMLGPYLILVE